MTESVCRTDGCERRVRARGLCALCYQRRRRASLIPRRAEFLENVTLPEREGDCWVWTGAQTLDGYGRIGDERAYRRAYRFLRGEVPDGLMLDHLCSNRLCVNPWHLEAVTLLENNIRAGERRTTCGNGHPWSIENTYWCQTATQLQRTCRACNREACRRRDAKHRRARHSE